MPNLKHAAFTSVWDGGFKIITPCTVNIDTREIIETEKADVDNFVCDHLDYEYVTVGGIDYPAYRKDELPDGDTTSYWYDY